MTYDNWLIKIIEVMKIRSVNYRMSYNDIVYLSGMVYEEVARDVNMSPIEQKVVIDKDTYIYDLDLLYVPYGATVALDTYKIENEEGINVSRYFNHKGSNVYEVNNYVLDRANQIFLNDHDTQSITFFRESIKDITTLTSKEQVLLFPVILAGMIWYTQDAIPNPTSSNTPQQGTNAHKQEYEQAKAVLRNKIPNR